MGKTPPGPKTTTRQEEREDLLAMGFSDPGAAALALHSLKASPLASKAGAILSSASASPSPVEALNGVAALLEATAQREILLRLARETSALENLVFILGASPFLRGLLSSRPELLDWLFARRGLLETKTEDLFLRELRHALLGPKVEDLAGEAQKTLRLYRQAEFLRLGCRDLLGLASMEETTAELSALAAAMLDAALEAALIHERDRLGEEACLLPTEPSACGLSIIGLGKLGAGELNYSSDIDIMYVYDEALKMDLPMAHSEFYTRLARRVNSLISQKTAHGIVFRIDLDLRPGGRSGPLVQSLRGAEIYYETLGRDWERAAMIKALCVAGDRSAGKAFLEMIRPFVYRRYLDFRAIEEIKTMKEKIDLAMARRAHAPGKGFNVKLGRGGIREIEFLAQTLQLIHGGKDPEVRVRPTMAALEALARRGYMKEKDARALKGAYVFLRNLEHRLQIIEDRQTHTLPADKDQVQRIARMMGFKDAGGLMHELYHKREIVHQVYRGLFYRDRADVSKIDKRVLLLFAPETSEDEQRAILREMGFRDDATALRKLELLRKGPPGLRRTSARARELFESTAPFLLSKILASPDPDMALANLERFVSSAGARTAQYALLSENPGAAEVLIYIFGTSEFLSNGIIERPEDIDILLLPGLSQPVKTKKDFSKEFNKEVIDGSADLETRLDAMRRVRNAEVLRIGLNHVSGAIGHVEVSEQMTDLAEAALDTAITTARSEVIERHPEPEGASFAIIGLGKLGARELGYGSDLDIIFVYDAGRGEDEDPDLLEYFVRLSQRIISAMTIRTREGSVFSIDTRLRPSGSSGPLVVSASSLLKYHATKTALWERQAFVRARCVAGERSMGQRVVNEVRDIVFRRPLAPEEVKDLLAMRRRMEAEVGPENRNRYNFKTGRGGIVDIEFLVQALELRYAGAEPELRQPATIPALRALREARHLGHEEGSFLEEAHAFLRRIEMAERISRDRPETFIPRDSEALTPLARALNYKGSDPGAKLLEDYEKKTKRVREVFLKTLETLLNEKE